MADTFELELLAGMPNYYDWIMEAFAPFVRGRVIEYGAGTGTISERLAPLAEQLTLVELSSELAASLRTRFAGQSGIEVVSSSLEDHCAGIGDATVDTVVMVNVLEHIEHDRAALAELLRMLRPGGHLLIFVPALQALMSKLDLMFGHYRRYGRSELADKAMQAGGDAVLCRYFDFIGTFPWFLLKKLLGATSFNPRFVQIHDRFVVPLSRAAERVASPPFGKNVILVARKRQPAAAGRA
jgi:SAM-dependent methyltransferase